MDWSVWGTWYTDSDDTTIKHIEHDGSYDSSCFDTDNGVTDSYGDSCTEYTSNPSWCNTYDTDTFISNEMCCACGGGTSYADDSNDDPDGIVYDEEYAFVASWYHNSTYTEDGYWVDIYEEVSGYWNYSDSSQSEGTWWHSNFTSQGTWYTSADDESVKHIVVTEAEPDGTYIDASEGGMNGYWFYNSSYMGGHWVNDDSTDSGYWEYDADDYLIGTWNNMDWSSWGTWSIDSEDSTIIHLAHGVECYDTNDGAVDSAGYGCDYYETYEGS